MVYIDLNPVHARMASGLEDSHYTSIRERLFALRRFVKSRALRESLPEADITELERMLEHELVESAEHPWMAPIGGDGEGERRPLLGLDPEHYVAIVETAGRRHDPRKRGKIPAHVRSALERMQIDVDRWLAVVTSPTRLVGTAIGSAASLAKEAARRGMRRIVGALEVCLVT
jgi:hypothetical protein